MSGIVPQGIYSAQFDLILQLAAAWLQFDQFESKIVHKVITAMLLENVNAC